MKGGYTKRGSNRPKTHDRLPITGEIMGEGDKYTLPNGLQTKNRKLRTAKKTTAKKTRAIRESKKKDKKDKKDKKEVPVKLVIDNKPNLRNSLLQGLRSSIKPLKNVKVKLPTPRSISMKTGSRRLISALVSNRFKQQMGPRTTRRATRRAKTI